MPPASDPKRDVLVALRERVRAATGADRELDARLSHQFERRGLWWGRGDDRGWTQPHAVDCWGDDMWAEAAGCLSNTLPRFTASVDAALALVERVLPGCQWSLEPDHCWIRQLTADDVAEAQGGFFGREGRATALVILDALLSALIAQTEAGHAGA